MENIDNEKIEYNFRLTTDNEYDAVVYHKSLTHILTMQKMSSINTIASYLANSAQSYVFFNQMCAWENPSEFPLAADESMLLPNLLSAFRKKDAYTTRYSRSSTDSESVVNSSEYASLRDAMLNLPLKEGYKIEAGTPETNKTRFKLLTSKTYPVRNLIFTKPTSSDQLRYYINPFAIQDHDIFYLTPSRIHFSLDGLKKHPVTNEILYKVYFRYIDVDPNTMHKTLFPTERLGVRVRHENLSLYANPHGTTSSVCMGNISDSSEAKLRNNNKSASLFQLSMLNFNVANIESLLVSNILISPRLIIAMKELTANPNFDISTIPSSVNSLNEIDFSAHSSNKSAAQAILNRTPAGYRRELTTLILNYLESTHYTSDRYPIKLLVRGTLPYVG